MMPLTVIMPVRNRIELTRQTIETLKRNTGIAFRLIIMADNVDPEMASYLHTVKADIFWVNFGQFTDNQVGQSVGQDVLRSMAVSIIDTPFFYFTDNDVYFKNGWIETLFKLYEIEDNIGIVGGRTSELHKVFEIKEKNGLKYKVSDQQAGYSMLIKKELWNKYGLYRNRFDDIGLNSSFRLNGYKIVQPLEPVIYHCGLTRSDGLKVIGYDTEILQKFPVDCIRL